MTRRDLVLARRAKRAGARSSLRIILEARRARLQISLAFAVVDHESSFRNIFGCDKRSGVAHPLCHKLVTPARVRELFAFIKNGGWSNGVGFTQLTYPPFIRQAESMGGAHIVKNQLRVGFAHLAQLLDMHNEKDALAIYNQGNPDGVKGRAYAHDILLLKSHWHRVLT